MENSLLNKLLDDFYSGIENRTTFFLAFNTSEKIFNWHFETWKKDLEYLKVSRDISNGLEIWSKYDQAHRVLSMIFRYIHKRILLDDTYTFHFYNLLTKHADKHVNEIIEINTHSRYYIEDLVINFSKVFFENFNEIKTNRDIWENFPKNWYIYSDISEKSPIYQLTLLKEFIDWAKDRVQKSEVDFDEALDDVSKNIFPDVDPVRWAHILIFALAPMSLENRVREVIYRKWTFGYMGRVRSYVSNSENFREEFKMAVHSLDESETLNTYKLTFRISFLIRIFTEENLENFIKQAESLTFDPNSTEEDKRKDLLEIFKGLKSFLKGIKKKS